MSVFSSIPFWTTRVAAMVHIHILMHFLIVVFSALQLTGCLGKQHSCLVFPERCGCRAHLPDNLFDRGCNTFYMYIHTNKAFSWVKYISKVFRLLWTITHLFGSCSFGTVINVLYSNYLLAWIPKFCNHKFMWPCASNQKKLTIVRSR